MRCQYGTVMSGKQRGYDVVKGINNKKAVVDGADGKLAEAWTLCSDKRRNAADAVAKAHLIFLALVNGERRVLPAPDLQHPIPTAAHEPMRRRRQREYSLFVCSGDGSDDFDGCQGRGPDIDRAFRVARQRVARGSKAE